jgi:molybdopterin synthase catalytic subunit
MYLTNSPIDVTRWLADVPHSDGGVCAFLGVVRARSEGGPTLSIQYEAFVPMAEAEMSRIARQLEAEWPGTRVRMVHRIGHLSLGEVSVAIVASSPHREEAFAACRAAIDRIKKTVPIWKKEFRSDGSSAWVDPTQTASD